MIDFFCIKIQENMTRLKMAFGIVAFFGLLSLCFFNFDLQPLPNPFSRVTSPDCGLVILETPKVIALPFEKILNVSSLFRDCDFGAKKIDFVLVVPKKLMLDIPRLVSKDYLFTLTSILNRYEWLRVIGGRHLVLNRGEKPACTMIKNGWTIELSENYSKFENGNESILLQGKNSGRCYPCDLLPDIFLVELSRLKSLIDIFDSKKLIQSGENARLALFLELKGRSAYCPRVPIIDRPNPNSTLDFTCNNLRTIWDNNFVLLPSLIGVYRLILHQANNRSIEHWLGCTWSKSAYDEKSILHCSNWLRQYLFDVVDILETKMFVEYRIMFGTLLGAVRSGDVIPWTSDDDIGLMLPRVDKFRRLTWVRLGEFSRWRYSHLDRFGSYFFWPVRAFPACPVRLTSRPNNYFLVDSPNRTDEIDRILKMSKKVGARFSHMGDWRDAGYVDLYNQHYKDVIRCSRENFRKDVFEYGSIGGRLFKTVPNPIVTLECMYKKTWNQTPPWIGEEWNSYDH